MTDLVQRLRHVTVAFVKEAADEIERLRAEKDGLLAALNAAKAEISELSQTGPSPKSRDAHLRDKQNALHELAARQQLTPVKLQFPVALRKMWSGQEVQRWLDNQGPVFAFSGKPQEVPALPPMVVRSAPIELDTLPSVESALDEVARVLKNHALELPAELLLQIVRNDATLVAECRAGAIADTAAREVLLDAVTNALGVPAWPCYGSSNEYVTEFTAKLTEAAERVGGRVLI